MLLAVGFFFLFLLEEELVRKRLQCILSFIVPFQVRNFTSLLFIFNIVCNDCAGVILCSLLPEHQGSPAYLVILDARNMKELARAFAPCDVKVALSFHGNFIPDKNGAKGSRIMKLLDQVQGKVQDNLKTEGPK